MGKIGNWDYPDMKIETALQIIEIIDNQFSGKASNMDAFAQALGHEHANSGALFYKIADLRKYRLIVPRGDIELTPLAEKIVHPNNPQERQDAIKEAVSGIVFFKKLYEVLGNKSTDSNLHIILQDKFSIDRKEAQESALKIRNIYNKILPYFSKADREIREKEVVPMQATRPMESSVSTATMTPTYTYSDTPEKIEIQFNPSTPLHFVFARQTLDELEKKYFPKEAKEKAKVKTFTEN